MGDLIIGLTGGMCSGKNSFGEFLVNEFGDRYGSGRSFRALVVGVDQNAQRSFYQVIGLVIPTINNNLER